MFLKNFHIFINKPAMLQQKFTVQVTTLPYCDDITQFDGSDIKICDFQNLISPETININASIPLR